MLAWLGYSGGSYRRGSWLVGGAPRPVRLQQLLDSGSISDPYTYWCVWICCLDAWVRGWATAGGFALAGAWLVGGPHARYACSSCWIPTLHLIHIHAVVNRYTVWLIRCVVRLQRGFVSIAVWVGAGVLRVPAPGPLTAAAIFPHYI